MASSEYTTEQEHAAGAPAGVATPSAPRLLVCLKPLSAGALDVALANITSALPEFDVQIASPDASGGEPREHGRLTLLPFAPQVSSGTPWLLTSADYINAYEVAQRQGAEVCLMLGADAQTLDPAAIRALADAAISGTDLVTPHYDLRAREGLVNSAILYPVTRALYGTRPRFPLAVDLAMSRRMAERLATAAQRFTSLGQNDALLWPVAEAAVAAFSIAEIDTVHRSLPQPGVSDLNTVLALIAGSLFGDVESKAAFWQRSRTTQHKQHFPSTPVDDSAPDIQPMLDSFRLAYTNLREIWSLVLPPQSLLGLKKLSLLPYESFRMPDPLWARTVYDFVLAYRLRTLNRGHLLGALTPLYLAWVASHLNLTQAGTPAEQHVEETAVAFESEKPYLVSRWRWPDRFNP